MVGFQKLVIDQKIHITNLAKEIGIHQSTIFEWFRKERIPEKHLRILSEKLNVDEKYLIEKVNDISTYKPKPKGSRKGFNNYKIEGNTAILYFEKRNGDIHEILVDADEIPRLKEIDYLWNTHYKPCTKTYYSAYTLYKGIIDGKPSYESIYLARFIMNVTDPNITVDHWNHDTLDNRKENLRITVKGPNDKHRSGKNSNNKSGYRNVCWDKKSNKWMIQLQIEGKNTVLKRFPKDQLDEAGAYAKKMREKYYGEFAGEG